MEIRIETGLLSYPSFLVPGVTSAEVDGTAGVALSLEPGTYSFQQFSGAFADFTFTVTPFGVLDYDSGHDGFLSGRGSTTLTVRGLPVTLDLTSLSHGLLGAVFDVVELGGGAAHELTLVPATGYRFISASGVVADVAFTLRADGIVVVDSRFAGFVRADGRRLTISGYAVTLDTRGLSHDLLPQMLGYDGGALAPGTHVLTIVPSGGYGFVVASGVNADLRLTVDVDGAVVVEPRFSGFAQAEGRTLTVTGYRLTLDTSALSDFVVPRLLGFAAGPLPPGEHSFAVVPAAGYVLAAGARNIGLNLDVAGHPALVNAPPGLNVSSDRTFCAEPDSVVTPLQIQTYGSPKGRWSRGALTVSIDPTGAQNHPDNAPDLTPARFFALIQAAFLQWESVTTFFRFTFVPSGGDIRAQFGGRGLNPKFGARGSVMGSAPPPERGLVGFDSFELWNENFLTRVALHEIGHALGLGHSDNPSSMMFPSASQSPGPMGTIIDDESRTALRNLYGWSPQQPLSDRATSDRPALAVTTWVTLSTSFSNLHMVWKGSRDDQRLFESRLENGKWTPQRRIEGRASAAGPSLATTLLRNGTPSTGLIMAWRGISGDQGIYVATNDGGGWTPQRNVPGVGSSHRPAVADFGGPVLAWKGIDGDQGIYFSRLVGGNWTPQQKIPGVGTAGAPTLAILRDRLFMFWRGEQDDRQVYFSSTDDLTRPWLSQNVVRYPVAEATGTTDRSIGSTHGPAAGLRGNDVILAWKGAKDDHRVWFSVFDGAGFSGQIALPGAGTSEGPATCTFDGFTHMVWKGVDDDNVIYWSTLPA